ncbi:zinc-binding dehydrogenase [Oceanibaculum indicum]|uniref:Zinc-binding dehydrogenase n=1 Tax=Oceanibaculum indicum P24 TaxID=1207063 RepID=K2JE82_9PROT|nr:zinc-binding dehydrogenase [Oceanibaculum indicum]EKE72962.1 zinc-binding dehydrogenase [Oceanibaculum indicum P24]
MKAILYSAHGGLDQISHGDYPTPTVGPDECLLKVKAVALNGFDPMILKGIPGLKTPFPMIPGGDIAGEVVDVGANVPGGKFRPGDRVQVVPFQPGIGQMGETLRGGACDYIAVDAKFLLQIPEGVSYEQAASLPIAYGTARRMMMVRGQVKEGEKVLVLGATGGVGTGAVQLAKMAGAYVIACASSAEKCEKLKEIGADETIDTSQEDFVAAIHERHGKPRIWGGGGVNVVVNYIGGDTWTKSLKVMCRFGRMLVCGATTGYDPKEDIRYIWSYEQSIVGSNAWTPEDQVALMEMVRDGTLAPVIDRVLPLTEANFKEGLQALIDRKVFGKVVFVP